MIRKFVKENFALILGLALPLLLVLFMILSSYLPRFWVPPPQYSLLYARNLSSYGPLSMYVNDGKLYLRITQPEGYRNANPPKLFIFDPEKKTNREIAFKFPVQSSESNATKTLDYLIPETEHLKLDPSVTAPDGYQYQGPNNNDGGLMFLIFASPRSRFSIAKQGNIISLPEENNTYYYYNPTFLGWIIEGKPSE